ncbi:MAG: TonB family protein [Pirellulales bacterium]|nr:TonB family protein [Pirellulales bacterium]
MIRISPALRQKITASATSLFAHGVACAGLVYWGLSPDSRWQTARMHSRRGVIQVQVDWSPSRAEQAPDAVTIEPTEPILVEPESAQIAERRFTLRPGSELPQLELSTDIVAGSDQPQPPDLSHELVARTLPQTDPQPAEQSPVPAILGPRQTAIAGHAAQPATAAGLEHFAAADFYNNPPPQYPDALRRARIEGRVMLEIHIDARGVVTSVTIRQSSGQPLFDASAVAALRQWRAAPARHHGRPVATIEMQEVIFQLPGKR